MRGRPDPRSGIEHTGDAIRELEALNDAHLANHVGDAVAPEGCGDIEEGLLGAGAGKAEAKTE